MYPHDDAEAIARALHLKRGGKGWVGQCPCCRYKSGFTIAPNRDGLPLIYCHAGGCTFLDIATALHRLGLWPDPDPAYRQPDPVEIDATALALRIWRRSVAADGTVVERYLRGLPEAIPGLYRRRCASPMAAMRAKAAGCP